MKTIMELITGLLKDGRTYHIKQIKERKTITAGSGAAPWKVGTTYIDTRNVLYINNEDIASCSASTHKEVEELVKAFEL